jgi:predicted RNA-binding Zn-ribbon protein involved in translation (DUF1610 family)
VIDRLELRRFRKVITQIERQELDIVLDPLTQRVCDRVTYERNLNLFEWECAVCGRKILADRRRNDAENFVCEECGKVYNNASAAVDRRILDSRTRMFRMMEERLYDELESRLDCDE